MKLYFLLLLLPVKLNAQRFTTSEIQRWEKQAKQVTIIRDNWGIPHIYGNTDADAVFGLLYAQCEDDFMRVEMNYIEKLGRLAEINGEKKLYDDLLMRLTIDQDDAKRDYNKSPAWLKKLLHAFADGINYYLYKKQKVKPLLLQRFEPWWPLLWTDGSIGAISTSGLTSTHVKNFYTGTTDNVSVITNTDPTGSNGFAFAPSITESKKAILYINPHVSFYFRPEVHMVSNEGLNVYGAVTWGQFFIYQGFNENCGWMHTSSAVDVSDLYEEQITGKSYRYGLYQFQLKEKKISLKYKSGNGIIKTDFTGRYTHHGPVLSGTGNRWLTLKASNRSLNGLIQSWQRIKTKGFNDYKKVMDLKANTSNNTVYADREGNIAYWHGNFIPVRDTSYNWAKPVDGTSSETEWKGLHKVEESIHIYNPSNGWLQNCNSTPFTAAGVNSPKKENYPVYMAPDGENFRAVNAQCVLGKKNSYTIDKVIDAGYDTYLSAFDILIPALLEKNTGYNTDTELYEAIDSLSKWNRRVSENSITTTLAVSWAEKILPFVRSIYNDQVRDMNQYVGNVSREEINNRLNETISTLKKRYGTWKVPWGDINRYQRTSIIGQAFSDTASSFPVAYASATWGMLPSFTSIYTDTNKRYGIYGNSFVCAVEFGEKIKAKSLLTGGQSAHPSSPHYNDQSLMYSKGIFKEINFYKADVLKNKEREYHPGQ